VEERVVALYALGRFDEAEAAGRSLPFQTRRSRLYRAAARAAMGDMEGARQIVAEALAAPPDLTTDYIRQGEYYRDTDLKTADRPADRGRPAGCGRQIVDGHPSSGLRQAHPGIRPTFCFHCPGEDKAPNFVEMRVEPSDGRRGRIP
jgi:hypothetical protein